MSPTASRPNAPSDYGYATDPESMLTWEQVDNALAAAPVYLMSTVLPGGAPSTHTIWGAFAGDCFFFEGGNNTRWAHNLAGDPRVSFGVVSDDPHLSGRGKADDGGAGDDFEAVRANYREKYLDSFGYEPAQDHFWRISPHLIIAIDASSMAAFQSSPTRFTFGDRP